MKARQSIGDLRENVWRWWNYKHIKTLLLNNHQIVKQSVTQARNGKN
jgi:hypothetical protein